MGDQWGVPVVEPSDDGATFTGTMTSSVDKIDVDDGKIEGNRLSWKAKVSVPIPMTLKCQATLDGDDLNGQVKAGAFGSMPFTGRRQARLGGWVKLARAVNRRCRKRLVPTA